MGKAKKEKKKREELECVGGVISRKITGADVNGMYVRGVAVVASVDIYIYIDIDGGSERSIVRTEPIQSKINVDNRAS